MSVLFLLSVAAAAPLDDPATAAQADALRAAGPDADALFGVGFDRPTDLADKVGPASERLTERFGVEVDRGDWTPRWALRPAAAIRLGEGVPSNLGGDREPGAFDTRLTIGAVAYAGPFALSVSPTVGTSDIGGYAQFRGFVGIDTEHVLLGFGKQDRWFGPGRRGNLLVSDNAEAPWMGNGALEGRIPGKLSVLGRFRAEVGVGWADVPRTDVQNPGLLLMDVRWGLPYVELGLTRLSMFGGEGRPDVDLGQLLIPSEPHIYEDPDQTLPDQNEQASIDVRVTLPVAHWFGGPLRHVEGWWVYGGEDMIVRELGAISYPALAGVGNLYGGEIGIGPVTASLEYAALLDDYFRWYTGHRVYHDGFTQDGRAMGWFAGGDSETWTGAVRVEEKTWRGRLSVDHVRRVGVIEAQNDRVFVLAQEEQRLRVGIDGSTRMKGGGWLGGGYTFEVVDGVNFVPGIGTVAHRAYVSWSPVIHLAGEGAKAGWAGR